ncbi:MAG: galactokinase, partial [Verrucomicrobiales bacterium]|nr:galactokinase [Verrucomicrobiales bacterium]
MAGEDYEIARVAREAEERFLPFYSRRPVWTAGAPGRVNLIGEHIDYNDGFVLPMAIGRYTVLAAAPVAGDEIVLATTLAEERVRVDVSGPVVRVERGWTNYVRGVVAGFQKRGVKLPGMEVMIHSNVPIGAGLSSSAALEVGMATLLEVATGERLDLREKALLCQEAEHQFAGVPCGIMDQFTSVLAEADHLLLIDCQSLESEAVPFEADGVTLMIADTNVSHALADGGYQKRRSECGEALVVLGEASYRDVTLEAVESKREELGDVGFRRARHVVTEMQRTTKLAAAAIAGEWRYAGELLYGSHESLRDDYEVSCRELDVMVEIARETGEGGGVYGCRMTGGGFGGSTVSLVETSRAEWIARRYREVYLERTGIEATIFTSRPAGGARVL